MRLRKTTFFAVLVFLITLTSCSSDSETNSDIAITPPEWIQGTWMQEGSNGFKFTNNDLILMLLGGAQQSQKELLLVAAKSDQSVSATNGGSSDSYSLTFNLSAGQSVVYIFEKLSDNSITWTGASGSVFIKQ